MSVDGYNSDMAYQLKRIADALEMLNRKLDEMTHAQEVYGDGCTRQLRVIGTMYHR